MRNRSMVIAAATFGAALTIAPVRADAQAVDSWQLSDSWRFAAPIGWALFSRRKPRTCGRASNTFKNCSGLTEEMCWRAESSRAGCRGRATRM